MWNTPYCGILKKRDRAYKCKHTVYLAFIRCDIHTLGIPLLFFEKLAGVGTDQTRTHVSSSLLDCGGHQYPIIVKTWPTEMVSVVK